MSPPYESQLLSKEVWYTALSSKGESDEPDRALVAALYAKRCHHPMINVTLGLEVEGDSLPFLVDLFVVLPTSISLAACLRRTG